MLFPNIRQTLQRLTSMPVSRLQARTTQRSAQIDECGGFRFPPSPYGSQRGTHHGSEQRGFHKSTIWKTLFFIGAIPVSYLTWEFFIHNPVHVEPPEFIAYPHLRLRTRPFPWGDGNHSLFHNPKTNALPDGYEEVDE